MITSRPLGVKTQGHVVVAEFLKAGMQRIMAFRFITID
jgi:hypothetical protein